MHSPVLYTLMLALVFTVLYTGEGTEVHTRRYYMVIGAERGLDCSVLKERSAPDNYYVLSLNMGGKSVVFHLFSSLNRRCLANGLV